MIRIGRESQYLPYAEFFCTALNPIRNVYPCFFAVLLCPVFPCRIPTSDPLQAANISCIVSRTLEIEALGKTCLSLYLTFVLFKDLQKQIVS